MKKLIVVLILMLLGSVAFANKQIIVLEANTNVPNQIAIHYLLWLSTNKPVPRPSFQSAWNAAGASELSALQAGSVVEESYTVVFPASLGTAGIKSFLNAHYTDRSAYFASNAQPGQYYGVFYDSATAWSQ